MIERTRRAVALRIPALVFAALLVALPGVQASAQDDNTSGQQGVTQVEKHNPPKIMVIYKEEVKAGRAPSHEKVETSFVQTYARIEGTRPYLAMTSLSGPTEAWFVEPANSFRELEEGLRATENAPAALKAQLDQIVGREANEIASSRQVIALYRDDLSYKPEFDMPRMRFVEVTTFRVRPGKSHLMAEAAKLVKDAHEKAKDGEQWMMYQVVSGAPMGTFYAFRPVESLEKIDPTNTTFEKAYYDALGKDGLDKLRQVTSDGYASIETAIFAFNPRISNAPKAFAAADSFWAAPGVRMASVGTSGKAGAVKKTSAVKETKKDNAKEKR